MIMRPTLMDSQADMWMISTPNGFNHFHSLFRNQIPNTDRVMFPEKDFESYHFTTYDNPYIPREEIENTKYTMTEDRFEQEMMAEFRKMEGLIYKEFSRETHVMKRSMEDFKPVFYIIGLDRGYNNPTAAPLIAVNWLRGSDLNGRPSGYEPDELPSCSTPLRLLYPNLRLRTNWNVLKPEEIMLILGVCHRVDQHLLSQLYRVWAGDDLSGPVRQAHGRSADARINQQPDDEAAHATLS